MINITNVFSKTSIPTQIHEFLIEYEKFVEEKYEGKIFLIIFETENKPRYLKLESFHKCRSNGTEFPVFKRETGTTLAVRTNYEIILMPDYEIGVPNDTLELAFLRDRLKSIIDEINVLEVEVSPINRNQYYFELT